MKVYGPYKNPINSRQVVIVDDFGDRKTMSYAKYLMQQYHGQKLSENEIVVYLDDNNKNDEPSNLWVQQKNRAL